VLRRVVSAQEEWRTSGNRRYPRGRAHLWIKLECGHYPVQRIVRLNKDKTWSAPSRCWCNACEKKLSIEQEYSE
jgi:hypothetical protein